MKTIKLEVNGTWQQMEVESDWSLMYVIREVLGLTGTKCGCGDGSCGACTVVMDGKAVRSCQVNALKADGAKVLTIEGMADGENLHPIQQAFIDVGAIQCGFCTPGMVLRTKVLLDKTLTPTEPEIRKALDGHICRCCGYQKIVEAIMLAAERMQG